MRYVDDGLATSVLPALAALEVFRDEPVALIAGGFDRGVDYDELAEALSARMPFTSLVTIGNAGLRISAAVRQRSPHLAQRTARTMREAVELARASLDVGRGRPALSRRAQLRSVSQLGRAFGGFHAHRALTRIS